MKINRVPIDASAWFAPSDVKPNPGIPVLVTDCNGITIAVWHKSIGIGGDFARIQSKGKRTVLTHFPGVKYWARLPDMPSSEFAESNPSNQRPDQEPK